MKKKLNKVPNAVILDEIKSNWAIEQRYIKLLYKLTHKMTADVKLSIFDNLDETDGIEALSVRFKKIYPKIDKRLNDWQVIFNKHSKNYATEFVQSVDKDVQKQLKNTIKKNIADDLVIKFDETNQAALAKVQGVLKENIDLIKDIPDKMKEKLQFQLTQSMQHGGNVKDFKQKVIEITGVTDKRAAFIARDQVFKATSAISHARQAEIGIKKQAWDYTYISKEPRKSHEAANGKIYEIDKGCLIDGEYIFPSQLVNCKCSSRPVLELG